MKNREKFFTFRAIFLLLSFLQLSFCWLNDETTIEYNKEMKAKQNALRMARMFGMKINANYWVLHYQNKQDSSWEQLWHQIMKEKNNIGYFHAH